MLKQKPYRASCHFNRLSVRSVFSSFKLTKSHSTLETDEVYEIGIMHLMCEILSIIYVDIYGYNSFDYDMEQLEDIYYNYHGTDYGDSISMSLIFYLLSGHSTLG